MREKRILSGITDFNFLCKIPHQTYKEQHLKYQDGCFSLTPCITGKTGCQNVNNSKVQNDDSEWKKQIKRLKVWMTLNIENYFLSFLY